MPQIPEIESLARGIPLGDRSCLSQGITLVESTLQTHAEAAERLCKALLSKSGSGSALRVAITGAPGVGKSTLIESLGIHLIESGNRVAVLSIDPSSPQTSGSILGDKTRMSRLIKHPDVFIRPSPSGNFRGGITHATRSAILLCEAAGYNPILIETVGTGQGDYAVRQVVDLVLLLVLAHAGDELQGIKRGILETADLIAVTKADGELKAKASSAAKAYRRALSFYPNPLGTPKVLTSSAYENIGISEIWRILKDLERVAYKNGHFDQQRQEQTNLAILETAKTLLMSRFSQSKSVHDAARKIQKEIMDGQCTINHAAQKVLDIFAKEI